MRLSGVQCPSVKNRLEPSWSQIPSHLMKLKWWSPLCTSETSNIYFLWSRHCSLVSASSCARRWLGLSRLRSHSVACKSAWESCPLTECKGYAANTFPHIAASCDMAAIQRGRPLDRTHHAEQEVGHAPRGRLPPWSEGKQGVWRNNCSRRIKQDQDEERFRKKLFVFCSLCRLGLQVVGGKMTETGRFGAFITKVKKGSLADVVGHLRAGVNPS